MFKKKGFTLIELLVVMGIIGLLASIIFARVTTARARARDARRVSDIRAIQTALTLYSASNNNSFPISVTEIYLSGADVQVSVPLQSGGFISAVPKDPVNTPPQSPIPCDIGRYFYSYIAPTQSSYTLHYCLETDSILGKNGDEGGLENNPQTATP